MCNRVINVGKADLVVVALDFTEEFVQKYIGSFKRAGEAPSLGETIKSQCEKGQT